MDGYKDDYVIGPDTPGEMPRMRLFPPEIVEALAGNGRMGETIRNADEDQYSLGFPPVVKIFGGLATWLITESDEGDPDRLFGLCDLGMGFPELGYVTRTELEKARVQFIGPIKSWLERDLYESFPHPIGVYARAARYSAGIALVTPIVMRAAINDVNQESVHDATQLTGYWQTATCSHRHGTLLQAKECRDEAGLSIVDIHYLHSTWEPQSVRGA